MDCSNQTLVQIPKNLPRNTVQLNLSHNLLTILNVSDLVNLKELQQLSVNGNQIEIIVNTDVSIVEMSDQNEMNDFLNSFLLIFAEIFKIAQLALYRFISKCTETIKWN